MPANPGQKLLPRPLPERREPGLAEKSKFDQSECETAARLITALGVGSTVSFDIPPGAPSDESTYSG
jgi:hypothetical protein